MAKKKEQKVDSSIQGRVEEIFKKLNSKPENQESLNQPYNLFTMWDMSENDHTKLLLSLLRFKQGNEYALIKSFMRRFAENIEISDNHQVEIYYNRKYVYYQEKGKKTETCNSFIDGLILIRDIPDCKNDRAIIIENKIKDAPDQPNQVRRYIYHMLEQETIEPANIWCFYIASDGSKSIGEDSYTPSYEDGVNNPNKLCLITKRQTEPAELNCHIGDRFVELNYKYDITSWLREDILDKRIYPESLTSVVRAYLESLEKDLFNDKPYEDLYQTILKTILKRDLNSDEDNPSVEDLLKEMTNNKDNYVTLYSLYDKVSGLKNEQDKKKGADEKYEELSNLEELRRGIKSLINKLERNAFDEFERCSVEILNQKYSEQLCAKNLKWQVKHGGLSGEKGFIQLRLDNGWNDAHLEWNPINTTKMYTETGYTLVLHVEKNGSRKDKIYQILSKDNRTQNYKNYKKDIRSEEPQPTPLAKMSSEDLYALLSKVYNADDIQAWCEAILNTEDLKINTETQLA